MNKKYFLQFYTFWFQIIRFHTHRVSKIQHQSDTDVDEIPWKSAGLEPVESLTLGIGTKSLILTSDLNW